MTTANTDDRLLMFHDGAFHEVPAERYIGAAAEDFGARLKAARFGVSQIVGDASGTHYELWEHIDRDEWIVVFRTAGSWCPIHCERWPDLIELLAKLSSIALAGAVQQDRDGSAFIRTK